MPTYNRFILLIPLFSILSSSLAPKSIWGIFNWPQVVNQADFKLAGKPINKGQQSNYSIRFQLFGSAKHVTLSTPFSYQPFKNSISSLLSDEKQQKFKWISSTYFTTPQLTYIHLKLVNYEKGNSHIQPNHYWIKFWAIQDQIKIQYDAKNVQINFSVQLQNWSGRKIEYLLANNELSEYQQYAHSNMASNEQLMQIFDRVTAKLASSIQSSHKLHHSIQTSHFITALSQTMSTFCRDSLSFFSICRSNGKIDYSYAGLTIAILIESLPALGCFLTNEYLRIIKSVYIYPKINAPKWIPLPQRVEFLTIAAKKCQKISPKMLSQIVICLNEMITENMLANLDQFQELQQIVVQGQIHPIVSRMINLKWRSSALYLASSSVYTESFTPDYLYHKNEQKLHQAISKVAWMIKATDQLSSIVQITEKDSQLLVELISLKNALQKYLKQSSIKPFSAIQTSVSIQPSKVYGYETFLTVTYGATQYSLAFAYRNLKTEAGLSSFYCADKQRNSEYMFRGNIHAYFSYVITKDLQQMAGFLNPAAVQQIKLKASRVIEIHLNSAPTEFATMWDQNGKVILCEPSQAMVSLLLLQEGRRV